MTALELVVPEPRSINLDDLVSLLADTGRSHTYEPFSAPVIDFCGALSQRIMRDSESARYPELRALAFFMRPAALHQLAADFRRMETTETVFVPRGLVFHLPPANVDTIFVYSWLLSILVGNRNVIRLSRRDSPVVTLLCDLFRKTLSLSPAAAGNTYIVRYGHEPEITAALSARCDVRVVWGGDETVRSIRRFELPPHARELTFPDRYSIAALKADAVAALDDAAIGQLAGKLFNDIYLFHQMACSSPRLVVWEGEGAVARNASARLAAAVAGEVRRRNFEIAPAVSLEKLAFAAAASLDGDAAAVHRYGAALTVIELAGLDRLNRSAAAGGLWQEAYVKSLAELALFIRRKDQTLVHFGFSREELLAFARQAGPTGIDRLVPAGEALNFNRYWDGMDLLREFVRCLHLRTSPLTP